MESFINKQRQKWCITLCLIIICMFGMVVVFPNDPKLMRINTDPTVTLLQFVLLAFISYVLMDTGRNKITVYDTIVGCLFSLVFTSTRLFFAGQPANIDLSSIYGHGFENIALNAISFIGWSICFTIIFSYIKEHFGKLIISKNVPQVSHLWLTIILIWLITVFLLLPGQISWDAMRQFCEFDGTKVASLHFTYMPTNHQPWITTLIFGSIFTVGRKIAGVDFGVFAVIIVQFVISSLIYSEIVKFVWKQAGKIFGIISLAIFASPIFSTYAVTIDKSTLYYAFAAWFYLSFINLFDLLKNGKKIKLTKDLLCYIFSAILFDAFRNDSFVIVFVASAILLGFVFYFKQPIRYVIIACLAIFVVHVGWQTYLNANNIIKSAPSEALTVPTRQLSYVVIHNRSSLNRQELETVNAVTPVNQLAKNFSITNGDDLKNLYPSNTFLNNVNTIRQVKKHSVTVKTTAKQKRKIKNYLKTWLKVGLHHPISYIKIYLAANATYLNPFLEYNNSLFLNYYPEFQSFLHPSWHKEYHAWFSENIRNLEKQLITVIVSLPPLALVLNAASSIWLSVLLFFLVLSLRNKKIAWLLVPQLLMCSLVTIVSVSGYSRYTIGILATLPITIPYCLHQAHTEKEERVNG